MTTTPLATLPPLTSPDAPADADAAFRQTQEAVNRTLSLQLFFIASCSKSGSTWLQHLLDGHPQICCHGEAFFPTFLRPLLNAAAQRYNGLHKCRHTRNRHQRPGDLTPQDVRFLYRNAVGLIMARWVGDDQVRAVGDKTPENAVSAVSLLEDFPRAKLIHLIRDGRDVCVSGWFHNLREKGPAFQQQFPTLAHYIPLMAGQKWVPYIQAARRAQGRWPDRYHEIKYEDLHTQPRQALRSLLRFLEVDDSDAAIDACEQAGQFRLLSGGRQRGQEQPDAFYRKGVAGDWKNHFDEACTRIFMQHAGDLLRSLGYEA